MNTLKLNVTIKEEKQVEKDIHLPYFCRKEDVFYKVVSDDVVLQVSTASGYRQLLTKELWLCKQEIAEAIEVSEEDFKSAYHETLHAIDVYSYSEVAEQTTNA